MPEAYTSFAHWTAQALELAGIGVIVIGIVVSTVVFFNEARSRPFTETYQGYRRRIGRAILLGLEFLVAGDIVRTVAVEPTYENVGILGLIVVIRTFLSFALEVEIYGRLPWQGEGQSSGTESKE